mmetsp:Transcript_8408/g.21520  ORF Transcript_8408/g.21520 Transcript_8408/m.21520 type:complete len:226 (+) Transcript_8408:1079-1756(+)
MVSSGCNNVAFASSTAPPAKRPLKITSVVDVSLRRIRTVPTKGTLSRTQYSSSVSSSTLTSATLSSTSTLITCTLSDTSALISSTVACNSSVTSAGLSSSSLTFWDASAAPSAICSAASACATNHPSKDLWTTSANEATPSKTTTRLPVLGANDVSSCPGWSSRWPWQRRPRRLAAAHARHEATDIARAKIGTSTGRLPPSMHTLSTRCWRERFADFHKQDLPPF